MVNVEDPAALADALCVAFAKALDMDVARAREAAPMIAAQLATLAPAVIAGRGAAQLAHELRNPLAVIATSASLLAPRVAGDERAARHARRIESQLAIASDLTRQLLEAGSPRDARIEPLDPRALVQEAVECAPLGEGFSVSIDADSAIPLVRVDHAWTRQAIVNLLRNAFEACSGSGRAWIVLSMDGPWVRVVIEDDGPGIPADRRATLFSGRGARGNGIGLSLARAFARAQGGELALTDSERGARFELTLVAEEGAR
jgi:signal transduction histidine kinase